MKYLFFLVLLANIILFLWEFNAGAFNQQQAEIRNGQSDEKQILLVGELQHPLDTMASVKSAIKTSETNDLAIALSDREGRLQELPDQENAVDKEMLQLSRHDENESSGETSNFDIEKSFQDFAEKFSKQKQSVALLLGKYSANVSQADQQLKQFFDIESLFDVQINANSEVDDEQIPAEKLVRPEEIKDRQPSAAALTTPETPGDKEPAKQRYCFETGLLDNEQPLRQWIDNPDINAEAFEILARDEEVLSSYLVYYPAAETFAKSKDNEAMLKQLGVTDLWLFRKGSMRGEISLGLFGKEKQAVIVQTKFIQQGLDVKVKPLYKTRQQLYARMTWHVHQADMDEIKRAFKKQFPDLGMDQQPACFAVYPE